jgi:pimeloyl-ACP methyl ester carboxylesterase
MSRYPLAMNVETKSCAAADDTTIVYSAAGAGEPALLFVHGGLADRHFWDGQLETFAARHRVLAPDLAGHGDSGSTRRAWGIREFGADVAAVAEAENLRHLILFGNSLGGPVAIEAALLLPGRVLGVVGIDTFQRLDYAMTPEQALQRAEAFRDDYAGNLRQMVKALFHPAADPAVVADAERRMAGTSPATAYEMFRSFGGYDAAAASRRLDVPLRAINGDLYPTDVAAVRAIKPDFDVVVMEQMGHYPMLERPAEFDRLVAQTIASLTG